MDSDLDLFASGFDGERWNSLERAVCVCVCVCVSRTAEFGRTECLHAARPVGSGVFPHKRPAALHASCAIKGSRQAVTLSGRLSATVGVSPTANLRTRATIKKRTEQECESKALGPVSI
eukprot:1187685-Prorocentrum_minimum.AAC.3